MIELACGDGRMRRGPYSPRAMSSPMIPALATNGLRFDDLFRADALAALDARFLAELASVAPETHARLVAYRACKGAGMEAEAVSEVLSESAPFLGDFVARLFGVANERRALMTDADQVTPIFRMQAEPARRAAHRLPPRREDLRGAPRAAQGDAIARSRSSRRQPDVPGTGHRICNDCMKACIFQKQEPVNIPQIETGILTDVLALPWGFEIYGLLTRWNPLNARRPSPRRTTARTCSSWASGPRATRSRTTSYNEGFGVVGIDGLKIEPLPGELLSATPIERFTDLCQELDERTLSSASAA
jgi:hypothetical protein